MQNEVLFIDCCLNSDIHLDLKESTETGRTRFRGKFQEADAENKNRRIYPWKVLDENVKKLQEPIKDNRLVGELDHPTDSIIHFKEASHKITRLWWEGSTLMGEGEILSTPHGKILKALLNDGVKIGISSRGVGNGKVNEDGVLIIGESYKLITFDAVADPSTFQAFQEKIVSKESVENFSLKNESRSIYTVNKNALIACIGGFVNEQTNNLRRGING